MSLYHQRWVEGKPPLPTFHKSTLKQYFSICVSIINPVSVFLQHPEAPIDKKGGLMVHHRPYHALSRQRFCN